MKNNNLWRITAVILLLSMICSLFVAVDRVRAEKAYDTVNVIVNMNDVQTFANAENVSVQDMLQTLKKHGVTQILFKEMSLEDLERRGQVEIVQGEALRRIVGFERLPQDLPIVEMNSYVVIRNPELKEQVAKHVLAKMPAAKVYSGSYDVVSVPSMISDSNQELGTALSNVRNLGVGFDRKLLEEVDQAGLAAVPQIRSWKHFDEGSARILKEELRAMPRIGLIFFNDKAIPGNKEDLSMLQAVLSDSEGKPLAPIGTIEFNEQKGLNSLIYAMDKNVVRLHTISNGEMSRFEGDTEAEMAAGLKGALDRWDLAIQERNMRALLVRFFDIDQPYVSFETNMAYLDQLKGTIEKAGFTLGGDYGNLQSVQHSDLLYFVIGLGVCAGFMTLLRELRFKRFALLGGLVAVVLWAALLFLSPLMARKLMALAAVIIFPTLSCIRFIPTKEQSLPESIKRLLIMYGCSLIGALLMVGLLSSTAFMLKLESFVGVKVAHVIPSIIVPFVVYIWQSERPLEQLKSIWQRAINYKWVFLFGVIAVALVIYVTRTGNDGATLSESEMMMRQGLTDLLGVRPRSKEFLIGYPISLLFFAFAGKRPGFWPLTIGIVIGQVSLVNTYAHIHTPLMVSLTRSFNGLLLGIILGVIAVWVARGAYQLYRTWRVRYDAKSLKDYLKKEG